MKTYYVNQVPVESIEFKVVDEDMNARSLAAYTSASVSFKTPAGGSIGGGAAVITDAAKGLVTYTFPSQTVFNQRGGYKVQLRLENSGRQDYCDIMQLNVLEPLEVTL